LSGCPVKQARGIIRNSLVAALIAGGLTAGAGGGLTALFGLTLFGDAAPFLQGLGAVGLALAVLFFPVFVPVGALLLVPLSWFVLRSQPAKITVAGFLACFSVAFMLLALCSGATTALFQLANESQRHSYAREQSEINHLLANIIRLDKLVVDTSAESVDIHPDFSGALAGSYRMTISIIDRKPLVVNSFQLMLPEEAPAANVSFPMTAIREGYRQMHMGRSHQTVIVDAMPMQVRAELFLESSSQLDNLERLLPRESPDRQSVVERQVWLDLGRF